MASGLYGGREVDVKVTIGRSGELVKTELKEHFDDRVVAYVVVRAAREWTFERVRDGNGPIVRQALLRFHLKHSDGKLDPTN